MQLTGLDGGIVRIRLDALVAFEERAGSERGQQIMAVHLANTEVILVSETWAEVESKFRQFEMATAGPLAQRLARGR